MNGPIRVAHVMGKMVGGGLEAVVMNYYRHIDRTRVQFDLLVDEDSTLVPRDEVENLGGRVIDVPPYQHIVSFSRELERCFREERWPIVHSHMNSLSVFALRAAKRAGVPARIAHSHSTGGSGELARNVMKAALKTQANRYPTHKLANTSYAGEWLFGKGSDFNLLFNAIDLEDFRFDPGRRASVRDALGILDSTFVVGHLGRFMQQKNHVFLIEAFARFVGLHPDTVLLLAGDGKLRDQIEDRVDVLGIADRVVFLGQRADASDLYQAFDCLAFPSFYEGLGIVLVEAQRAGLPCLVSEHVPRVADVTGTTEFLPIDNAGVWAKAMQRLAMSPARDRGLPGMDGCFTDYDIGSAAPRLVAYYEDLANGRAPMSLRTGCTC